MIDAEIVLQLMHLSTWSF